MFLRNSSIDAFGGRGTLLYHKIRKRKVPSALALFFKNTSCFGNEIPGNSENPKFHIIIFREKNNNTHTHQIQIQISRFVITHQRQDFSRWQHSHVRVIEILHPVINKNNTNNSEIPER
jgi:hypothetical protein